MGNDFRAAYAPDTSLDGAGQTVGLLQFDGYTASDITYYENQAGLPNVTLSNVLIDGASGGPSGSGGEVEVSLDIEMAISMAPGLSEVMVYMEPNNGSPWEDILNRMADDNLAKQMSCSWYSPDTAANPVADQIFQQMASAGPILFLCVGRWWCLYRFDSVSRRHTLYHGSWRDNLDHERAGRCLGFRIGLADWQRRRDQHPVSDSDLAG